MTKKAPLPKILVADDDPEIAKMVEAALRPIGADLVFASNGEEAIEQFLVEKPDLVILDVMMPRMSGWEVAKYIRDKETDHQTRLLMLTGIGEVVNQATSPLMGADDFLDKPFTFEVLVSRVRALLQLST